MRRTRWGGGLGILAVTRTSFSSSVEFVELLKRENNRCEQDSNLRGQCPLNFKSNALTARPSQLL